MSVEWNDKGQQEWPFVGICTRRMEDGKMCIDTNGGIVLAVSQDEAYGKACRVTRKW